MADISNYGLIGVSPSLQFGQKGLNLLTSSTTGVFDFSNGGRQTGALVVPYGTTGQEPAYATTKGGVRLNTTTGSMEYSDGTAWIALATGGVAVTAVSVATANGLAGTSSLGTTPQLTLSTTVTGILKGNGTAISAAVSGTDLKTVGGNTIIGSGDVGTIGATYGGTGSSSAPTVGQFLFSSGGTSYAPTTLSSQAVTSITGTANEITASVSTGAVTLSIPSTFIAPGSMQSTSTMLVGTDLTVDGLTYESAATGITAYAGGGQGSATQLTKSYNVVTTVASSGDSVKLPASGVGLEITVMNTGTGTLAVFPQTGDQIDGGAVNASVSIPSFGSATYQSVNSGNWYTIDPVVVTSGAGLSVTYSPGETVLSNTGVTSFQTSLSGLTPNGSSTGAITLAGTLGVASGGTGDTTLTLNGMLFGNGTSPVGVTAAGSHYQVLQAGSGGVPAFDAVHLDQSAAVTGNLPLGNGGTNASLTAVAGAPVYSTASAFAVGTAGTTGQAYISGGTSAPTWQTVASTITTNQILEGDGTGQFVANGASFVGSGSFSGVTLNGTVTNPTDAATKAYVDSVAAGLTWKDAVAVFAIANVPLTGSTPLVIDGYTVLNNDRLLLAGETSGVNNGIYVATITGGSYSLARSSDMATSSNADDAAMFVENGTVYKNSGWVETATPAIVGTNALTFAQFSGGSVYTFNQGLTQTGSTINVNTDGTTTYIDGSNNVAVKSSSTANQVLLSNGTSTTPAWGALPLGNTNAVSGTLAVGNGGTGSTSFTTDGVVFGGASLGSTAAGATGQVLVGNTGSAPSFSTLSGIAVTSLTGTANEITVSTSTGVVTLSLPSAVILPGSLEVTTTSKFDGLTYESTGSVTATAGNPALTAAFSVVTTTGSGQGVTLPVPAYAGAEISVVNISANSISVYPNTGGTIDSAGINNPIVVPAGGTWTGQASTTTQWYSIDPVIVNGTGISVTYSNGQTSISNTGVLSFSGGTTGLTPPSGIAGNVTLAGTLATTNGGTGLTFFTANEVFYAGSSSTVSQSGNFTFDGTSTLTLGGANSLAIDGANGSITAGATNGDITLNPNGTGVVVIGPVGHNGFISSAAGYSLTVTGDAGLTLGTTTAGNIVLTFGQTSDYMVVSSVAGQPTADEYASNVTGQPNAIPNVQYVTDAVAAATVTEGSIQSVRATVPLNANGVTDIGAVLPTSSTLVVLSVKVMVNVADTTATLSVGVSGTPAAYMLTSENDPSTVGLYIAECYVGAASGAQIIATVASTAVTSGSTCTVFVEYAV